MALVKRNPNDRNEKAVKARTMVAKAQADADGVPLGHYRHPTDGVIFKLNKVDIIFLQRIQKSLQKPEVPTYKVKTVTGREQEFTLDEKSANEFLEEAKKRGETSAPEYEAWVIYQAQALEYYLDQMVKYTRALYLEGTEMPEGWENPKWERRMAFLEMPLPDDPQMRWTTYLETTLQDQVEIAKLNRAILAMSDVDPEAIALSEESFRPAVQTDDGREDLAHTVTDTL